MLSQLLFVVTLMLMMNAGYGMLIPTSERVSVALSGSTATFGCKTDTAWPIRWVYFAPSSKIQVVIYTGAVVNPSLRSTYEVHCSNNKSDIVIKDTPASAAGGYICSEIKTAASQIRFELVVLAACPACSTNLSLSKHPQGHLDNLTIGCSVNYSGNIAPRINCLPTIPGEAVTNDMTTQVVKYSKALSAMSLAGDNVFTCQIVLTSNSSEHSTSTVAKVINWCRWTSPIIRRLEESGFLINSSASYKDAHKDRTTMQFNGETLDGQSASESGSPTNLAFTGLFVVALIAIVALVFFALRDRRATTGLASTSPPEQTVSPGNQLQQQLIMMGTNDGKTPDPLQFDLVSVTNTRPSVVLDVSADIGYYSTIDNNETPVAEPDIKGPDVVMASEYARTECRTSDTLNGPMSETYEPLRGHTSQTSSQQ